MRFVKDTLITFYTQIGTLVLGIAAAIIIARVLGPSGKGAYTLIILVPTLLAALGNLGIGMANIYFIGKERYELKEIASNSIIAGLGLGIILTFASLIYLFVFQPSFLEGFKLWLFIATLALPAFLIADYFQTILLGENKINQYNLVLLAQSSVILILLAAFLFAFKGGVLEAILAWTGGVLFAAILAILLVRQLTKIGWSFHWLLFKDSVKFGVQGHIGNIIGLLNYRLDMILISFFMGVTFVGYYSVAVGLVEALWYFPGAVGTVLFARTSGLTTEEANESTPRICRNSIFLTFLAAILLFGLGKTIITLFFGASFLPALKPLWILLPGVVFFTLSKVLGNELNGRGKPIIGTIAAAVSLGVNIPLNLLLIPIWGISGAAFASTISYSLDGLIILIAFLRISQNSLFDTLIIKPRDLKIYTSIFTNGGSFFISKLQKYFTKKI